MNRDGTTGDLLGELDELDRMVDKYEDPVAGETMDSWFRRMYRIQVEVTRIQIELARRSAQ